MTKLTLIWLLVVTIFGGVSGLATAAERLKVASLHPLITDVARQVAGQKAMVVQVIDPHADPHHFKPTPKALLRAKGAKLFLASGKGMESYLPKLRSTLGGGVKVVEVGRTIPSIRVSARDRQYVCCPQHATGAIDPHWWHKISNMQKAARVIAKEFGIADPANAAVYKANAAAYSSKLAVLDRWVKRELSKVPRGRRVLATAHAAFGYFCKEYGFKALPVQGLTAHQKPGAAYQAKAIREARKHGVTAIFPEQRANPKSLKTIAKGAGIKLGGILKADGASSYEGMMRHNVKTIVRGLTGGK